jgi:hypothetical protein
MVRSIISVIVFLVLAAALTGCSPGKKSYTELRGLMLLENTQIGRNRSYYSKHKAYKISKAHKKLEKKKVHQK